MKIHHCQIEIISNSNHVQQIYCGLEELYRKGKIQLKQTFDYTSHLYLENLKKPNSIHSGGVKLIVNDKTKIYIDVSDSKDIHIDGLDWCTLYLKRSYNRVYHFNISKIIQPFDLNYMVVPNSFSRFSLQRVWKMNTGKERVKALLREIDTFSLFSYLPRLKKLAASPQISPTFKILFLCRLWEPTKDAYLDLSEQQIIDRITINDMRINCIKAMKAEFGQQFVGGLVPTEYAKSNFSEFVFENEVLTQKSNYINFLKSFSVCVATTGLANSIGWKFGEYISLSKAIVSEKLFFETEGKLEINKHYLEFNSPEECIYCLKKLRDDQSLLQEMQKSNYKYYIENLQPEKLMMNIIESASSV
jgi:hypothetical protein